MQSEDDNMISNVNVDIVIFFTVNWTRFVGGGW